MGWTEAHAHDLTQVQDFRFINLDYPRLRAEGEWRLAGGIAGVLNKLRLVAPADGRHG